MKKKEGINLNKKIEIGKKNGRCFCMAENGAEQGQKVRKGKARRGKE